MLFTNRIIFYLKQSQHETNKLFCVIYQKNLWIWINLDNDSVSESISIWTNESESLSMWITEYEQNKPFIVCSCLPPVINYLIQYQYEPLLIFVLKREAESRLEIREEKNQLWWACVNQIKPLVKVYLQFSETKSGTNCSSLSGTWAAIRKKRHRMKCWIIKCQSNRNSK